VPIEHYQEAFISSCSCFGFPCPGVPIWERSIGYGKVFVICLKIFSDVCISLARNISSAAFKLNVQQTPASVGNVVKIAAHSMGIPFNEQYFRNDVSKKFRSHD
jgi:hypothetical protein